MQYSIVNLWQWWPARSGAREIIQDLLQFWSAPMKYWPRSKCINLKVETSLKLWCSFKDGDCKTTKAIYAKPFTVMSKLTKTNDFRVDYLLNRSNTSKSYYSATKNASVLRMCWYGVGLLVDDRDWGGCVDGWSLGGWGGGGLGRLPLTLGGRAD